MPLKNTLDPRVIICDTEGCPNRMAETELGAGFPRWGGLEGRLKDKEKPRLCPECTDAVQQLIQSGGLRVIVEKIKAAGGKS